MRLLFVMFKVGGYYNTRKSGSFNLINRVEAILVAS